jgi:hypothetical protein
MVVEVARRGLERRDRRAAAEGVAAAELDVLRKRLADVRANLKPLLIDLRQGHSATPEQLAILKREMERCLGRA